VRRALREGTLALTRHRVVAEFLTQVVATLALFGHWDGLPGRPFAEP